MAGGDPATQSKGGDPGSNTADHPHDRGNDGAGRAPGRSISDELEGLLRQNTFGDALSHGVEDTLTRLVRLGFSTEMLPGDHTYDGLDKGHDVDPTLAWRYQLYRPERH